MSEFRHLTEMGVEDVTDIERYTLRLEGDDDVLKIYFKKDKGDWFSRSKKFKFKRFQKTVRVNEGNQHYREVTEMSPYLLKAVEELDRLVARDQQKMSEKERLMAELEHLDKVVSRKISDMRRLIESMD
ncbi:DUF3461 family protein [Pokkaliibacter sp. CJK22405]|uniref:DUF3461 family protein n=1 Tax=Pokkaliibacter sp. CJK22405 TaxID=3384615 RepID=UPI00398557A3